MRILLVTELTGRMTGGPITAAVALMHGLQAAGHELALVSDRPYAGAEHLAAHHAAPVPVGRAFGARLAEVVTEFRPDLVHVLAMGQRGLARVRPVLHGTPWLVTLHSIAPFERILPALHGHERLHYLARSLRFAGNNLGWRWLLGRGAVPHMVVHSRVVRDAVLARGQPADRVSVIDLALPAAPVAQAPSASFRPRDDGPLVVTVAGTAHTKGLHDGLLAVHALRHRFPRLEYRVAGEVRDRSYLAHLEATSRRLGLQGRVLLGKRVDEATKQRWLSSADLYLQPSHEEGFCLSFLEAARQVPRLVGTQTGAIAEIAGNDPWMRVVPPRRPRDLAAAMAALLDAAAPCAERLAQRRAALSGRFSLAQHVQAHQALYARVVSDFR